jgi:HD-like signal output (HDOD) protein
MAKTIESFISAIHELPTIPTIAAEILDITTRERTSAHDLTRVIVKDQALSSKVLKVANSPFYGLSKKVSSINHAIVILGFDLIKNITMAISVYDSLYVKTKGTYFNRLQFWEHSVVCGLASRILLDIYKPSSDNGMLPCAGLIHDVGKVILDRYFNKEFFLIVDMVDSEQIPMEQAELDIIGLSHADLGRLLLERWKFPKEITEAIGYHHRPWESEEYQDLSSITYLANMLSKMNGYLSYSSEPKISYKGFQNSKGAKFLKERGLKVDRKSIEDLSERLKSITSQSGDLMFLSL